METPKPNCNTCCFGQIEWIASDQKILFCGKPAAMRDLKIPEKYPLDGSEAEGCRYYTQGEPQEINQLAAAHPSDRPAPKPAFRLADGNTSGGN